MARLSAKTENYFDEAYWNNRYSRDSGSFDWYQHYREIAPLIKMYTKTSDEVLMVGCGSARKCLSPSISFTKDSPLMQRLSKNQRIARCICSLVRRNGEGWLPENYEH